jgi:ribosomal protein L37E
MARQRLDFFTGVDEMKEVKAGGGSGQEIRLQDGESVRLWFLVDAEEIVNYREHQFEEEGNWNFVPCTGAGCPLCKSPKEKVSKNTYRFLVPVWDIKNKQVSFMKGSIDLKDKLLVLYAKYSTLLDRSYEYMREGKGLDTDYYLTPEDKKQMPKVIREKEYPDPVKYLEDRVSQYYGDGEEEEEETPKKGKGKKKVKNLCPECEEELDEDGDCPECGWESGEKEEEEEESEECPECGEDLDEDGECPECGYPKKKGKGKK